MNRFDLWLALGLGPCYHAARDILDHFGSAEAVYERRESLPRELFSAAALRRLREGTLEGADAAALRAAQCGAKVLTVSDARYPDCFRILPDLPLALYYQGDLSALGGVLIGVVGSREATDYGLEVAYALSRDLASAGAGILSGFARGIDAAAHDGALAAGGVTIGVLGCGIDRNYPAESGSRRQRMIEGGGLILSDYPPGTAPHAANFPQRNRLIAALSHGVVVAQAAMRSGSLITARLALDLGRDVFAVPDSYFSDSGANKLIQDGAYLVTGPADVLSHYLNELRAATAPRGVTDDPAAGTSPDPSARITLKAHPLTPEERAVLDCIGYERRHLDDIALALGMPVAKLLPLLLALELRGAVRALPGRLYAAAQGKSGA